jgi:uncharacterized DUF497 family protein
MNSWDEAKRQATLAARELDFADAEQVIEGRQFTRLDDRRDYGEPLFITVGFLAGRFVVVTWTPREGGRRIISMRHGHDREKERFEVYLD